MRLNRAIWIVVAAGMVSGLNCGTDKASDPGNGGGGQAFEVERILKMLAPRQRAVMHLTVVEGMSDSEIGSVMGIDAASVRSHRRRAKERLRPVLAEASAGGR